METYLRSLGVDPVGGHPSAGALRLIARLGCGTLIEKRHGNGEVEHHPHTMIARFSSAGVHLQNLSGHYRRIT